MYVYDCNYILTTAMKNISDKEMIKALKILTEDLRSRGINLGFHLMGNKASTSLNTTMNSRTTNYQLAPHSNYRETI